MRETPEIVSVFILDKEYQISCPPEEVEALMESAAFLDQKMREVKQNSSIYGLDRIAVMAALNITNDYISQTNQSDQMSGVQEDSLRMLGHKVDQVVKRLKNVCE